MRRQRFDWLAMFFKRGPKKAKVEKIKRVRKKPTRWWYQMPNGLSGTVTEFTRSEARAAIKQALGLKSRVPIGTVIEKVSM